MKGVSIIMCCYNSAERLPKTLYYLFKQNISNDLSIEIIIVNNNSNDNTVAIALKEWEKYSPAFNLKIINENKRGLIFARLRGAEEAKHDIIVFCDDDNWLEESYVNDAFQIMNDHPNVAVLGGRSVGYFDIKPPEWFAHFQTAYAIGKPFFESGIVNHRKYIAGAGMVMRKSFFQLLKAKKFEPVLIGRKGDFISSGEDAELCRIALYMGFDLYYDKRLFFHHYITASRLNWKYFVQLKAKGHALPQVYFTLYDYCYSQLCNNRSIIVKEAFKKIWEKPVKIIGRNCKSFKGIVSVISCLLISKPGSSIEIEIKAQINKLLYFIFNRRHIRNNLKNIEIFLTAILEDTSIPFHGNILSNE